MSTLAIVGTGIAGMGCAHFLHRRFDVTLFEQNDYTGGHTNTITLPEKDTSRPMPIDTGFMVFNHETYPHLTRLFKQLNVPVKKTDMSFSVRHADTGLEYAGSSLNHLFAQRRNIFRPRFIRMLLAIDRFNREALEALNDPCWSSLTLSEYARARDYGEDFSRLYLIPMSSAVWSTSPEKMLGFPATTLLRFFQNHGFLGLHTQHQWWTVDGGAQEYTKRLTAPWQNRIRHNRKIVRVQRKVAGGGVALTDASGTHHRFDRVILACHADQSLQLLADPTADETRLLQTFHYQTNLATLHTDTSVMPRKKLAWSSWNYSVTRNSQGEIVPATHYWMNRLQNVSDRENYFVSINGNREIDPGRILKTIQYEHPLFSLDAVGAQREIPELNRCAQGRTETFYTGAWQRYGFHEDGLLSAVNLSQLLLQHDPWDETPKT
jgi:predicted NAD/FAD-binding protein